MKRSKILTGVLLTTALVSAALPTVSYAEGDFSTTSNGGISTAVSTNSTKFSNYLEEAKTQTEQLQSLIDSGTIDANILKSIGLVIKTADDLFCDDDTIVATDTDVSNLKYIWEVYNTTKFDALTISGTDSISAKDVESYVNDTKTHVWGILKNSGVDVGSPDFTPTQQEDGDSSSTQQEEKDTNLYGSLNNFKRVDTSISFADVNKSQWFYDEVMEASQLGLFKGNDDGTFNPEGHLTYAEAVALAARVHATYYDNKQELDDFNNRPVTNHWADNTIAYADKYGITSTVKGITTLDAPCTRQQMADLFVSAIVPYEVNHDSMFISGVFTQINDMSKAPEQTNSPSIQILFKAGILVGDAGGFRPTSSITRAETACILNRVATPSKRKKVTTPKPSITSPSKPSTSTKFSTDIPKDPTTGKFIPTNDPTMAAYNRPELVNFIYTTMQDAWFEGGVGNYQGLYNTGSYMMADAFGGFMQADKNMYANGVYNCKKIVSRDTFKTLSDAEISGGYIPRGTVEDIQAGDFISIPNWVNAKMLVAERKQDSVIVIEPTVEGSGAGATFRWREYTLDKLESKLGDYNSGIYHFEFNEL